MKLASLNDGTRDGQLVVVSSDLARFTPAGTVASTLQDALDNWVQAAPALGKLGQELDLGMIAGTPFDEGAALSPLPRAYQWADGSAYVNHVDLVRRARGAELPKSFWTDPLMYQGGADAFLAPRAPVVLAQEEWGIDFEAEIAVITDDVPMGVSPGAAGAHIKLVMLVNDVSLRNLIPGELAKGFGFLQSKPRSALSPVFVTPDELGEHWRDCKVHLPLITHLNQELFGKPEAGVDMQFNFAQLIAHAAMTRSLSAGTLVGSGTVANQDESKGASCLAEKRVLEIIASGKASTPFMSFGDQVRIEMLDSDGHSIFGAIEQQVVAQSS